MVRFQIELIGTPISALITDCENPNWINYCANWPILSTLVDCSVDSASPAMHTLFRLFASNVIPKSFVYYY